MKIFAVTGYCLCLSACAIGGGPSVADISSPKGATLAGLGDNPAKETAECMSRILHVAAQADGEGYLLTTGSEPQSSTYRVRPIADKLGRYKTQVDQTGAIRSNLPVIGGCLTAVSAQPL